MPYRGFLARIRRLFAESDEHLRWIAEAFAEGRLKQPVSPMSDSELARAIREFRAVPPSFETLSKLGSDLSGNQG